MNEGGEIMVTPIMPEVALELIQDVQTEVLSPAKNVDEQTAQENPEAKEPAKEVEQVREELEELTEKKQPEQATDQENETSESIAEEPAKTSKEKERIVIDTAAQLKRSLALTFQIILYAVFAPNEPFSGKKLGLSGDPAKDPKTEAINERLHYGGQSWEAAKKAIEAIEEEQSFGKFLGRVLAESEKVITYKVEKPKKEKKAKKRQRFQIFAFSKK